jgi:hypothetical protein
MLRCKPRAPELCSTSPRRVIGKQNRFKTCHSERGRSVCDGESKNPESVGCDYAVTGSSTETALGERLDAAIAETLHRDPSTRARVHARHAQDDSGRWFRGDKNRSIKDRRHRVFRKNKTVLELVILSAAGAYATVESKNPESAGCDYAVTGSSTETALGERLDAAIAETLHRDPSTRARVHARHAQDDSGR